MKSREEKLKKVSEVIMTEERNIQRFIDIFIECQNDMPRKRNEKNGELKHFLISLLDIEGVVPDYLEDENFLTDVYFIITSKLESKLQNGEISKVYKKQAENLLNSLN